MSEALQAAPGAQIGRPPRELTDTERRRLAAMAAMGLNQVLAGARIGVSDRTLREIFKRDEEAALCWFVGRAEAAEKALKLLWKSAEDGQPAAQIFLGKCLAGLRETGVYEGAEAPPAPVQINFQIISADGSARPLKRVGGNGWDDE